MNKKYFTILLTLTLLTGIVSAQPSQGEKTRFNPFTAMENFVENTEVQLAGFIGGSDLKAKALANNAEESLQEAERLAKRNRSKAAARKIQKYEKNLNKSQNILDQGQNPELKDQVQKISNQNIQRLEEVRKKVPKQAQKGIKKALNNAKNREKLQAKDKAPRNNLGPPEKPLKNIPNNQTKNSGKPVEKNLSKPGSKPERNQIKPKKGKNKTGKQETLSEKKKKTRRKIKDENGSAENETDKSNEKPVENVTSQPSLGR